MIYAKKGDFDQALEWYKKRAEIERDDPEALYTIGVLCWDKVYNGGLTLELERRRELIDMGAFIENHQTYSWQEALPFMVKGEAASYLMGNFAVAPLRDAGLTDDSGWCPVHQRTFESKMHKDVYVIGDASIAGKMTRALTVSATALKYSTPMTVV